MGRTYAVKTSYKHSTKKRTHNAEKRKHRGIRGLLRGAAKPDQALLGRATFITPPGVRAISRAWWFGRANVQKRTGGMW
jgi:hypothetical protein